MERRAFRLARVATRDDDEAVDVVQDAMMSLVRRYADAREEDWPPLFHRILQSRIRDWYRRRKVRDRWHHWFGSPAEASDDGRADGALGVTAGALDQELAHKRAGAALQQALHRLPLRQQQAFLLRAWEELDVAQTARAMGCSEGSVKTHYARALQALRRELGEHWP